MATLAGMRTRSQMTAGTFDAILNDPPTAAWLVLRDVVATCDAHHVSPIGALEVAVVDGIMYDDRALRWELKLRTE